MIATEFSGRAPGEAKREANLQRGREVFLFILRRCWNNTKVDHLGMPDPRKSGYLLRTAALGKCWVDVLPCESWGN